MINSRTASPYFDWRARSINCCKWIGGQAVRKNAENDRPDDSRLERLFTGKILVKYDHDKHDASQTPRSELPEEQFVRDGQSHPGQAQEDRQHADDGVAENRINQHIPCEVL